MMDNDGASQQKEWIEIRHFLYGVCVCFFFFPKHACLGQLEALKFFLGVCVRESGRCVSYMRWDSLLQTPVTRFWFKKMFQILLIPS